MVLWSSMIRARLSALKKTAKTAFTLCRDQTLFQRKSGDRNCALDSIFFPH
jgi:hypothetical protein